MSNEETVIWYEGLEDWVIAEEDPAFRKLLYKYRVERKRDVPPPLVAKTDSSPKPPPRPPSLAGKSAPPVRSAAPAPEPSAPHPSNLKWIIVGVSFVIILVIVILLVNNSVNEARNEALMQHLENKSLEAEQAQQQADLQARKNRFWANYQTGIELDYKADIDNFLGGIYKPVIFVSNNMDTELSQLMVKVKYIKANGGTYKTEFIELFNVKPGKTVSQDAPSSDRRQRLQLEIVKVSSKELNVCANC